MGRTSTSICLPIVSLASPECWTRKATSTTSSGSALRKQGEERVFTHIHVQDRYSLELTVYATDLSHYVFKSSITGKPIERASIAELEQFLAREYPDLDLDEAVLSSEQKVDRFQIYEMLLLPLEHVKQSPKWHPEGDALYHSLQVFDLACEALPYDEEFQLAALLHDVGKAIDPHDHVAAGLEALEGYITLRTAWLIEHHMEANGATRRNARASARLRLQANESFDELMLLDQCDRKGRQRGVEASELHEAIEHLRELARTCGSESQSPSMRQAAQRVLRIRTRAVRPMIAAEI